ncbi:MAG: septum formation protein Maf [Selenomonadaceae bacterium]|nr:septum formation protein Maf [Selenomonadaceae bacterium]
MIILASGSPRREELLKKICKDFIIHVSDTEEFTDAASPSELALENAKLKAASVAKDFPNDTVIAADTIVALGNKIFGKPKDFDDACAMLRKLSGNMHEVTTGLAIIKNGQMYTAAETTEVYFGEMSDEQISDYVKTGEPMDKSGSYALQGGAAPYIKKINGDWSNVVGLPLYRLRNLLSSLN